ncbi:MAG: TerB N-terminal domain-containing protein [Lautropia sp.]|nr:TerB N-terminal domain-containing protein [Lautropia sp.]
MLKKVVTGLICCGVVVVVLASFQAEPEPWFGMAALLFLLGLMIAATPFLMGLAGRLVRDTKDRVGVRYRRVEHQIKRSKPVVKTIEKFTQQSSRPTRPLWQSEATYEQEREEPETLEALVRYAPRSSMRLAAVRVHERVDTPDGDATEADPALGHIHEHTLATDTVPLPVSGAENDHAPEPSFPMPRQPRSSTPSRNRWVPPGQAIEIAGLSIGGGMLYVGQALERDGKHADPGLASDPTWVPDPALLDISLAVDIQGDYRQPLSTDAWPNYARITPGERGAYLQWLRTGRSAADADIGYVFLFFCGLERRVLIDGRHDADVQAEFPVLAAELDRLLGIYGGNPSFGRYANQLLGAIAALSSDDDHYLRPLPTLARENDLPLYLKIVLGQCAIHAHPLPVDTALAWVRHSPGIVLHAPVSHCPALFETAFRHRYQDKFGDGLNVPVNPTALRHDYHGASAALANLDIRLDFGKLPDVSVSTAPIRKLNQIVELATDDITDYCRYIEKNPSEAGEVDALLMLPKHLWPSQVKLRLTHLRNRLHGDMRVTSVPDLWRELGLQSALTRPKLLEVLSVLADHRVLMVPDVLRGARMPKHDEPIVLFEAQEQETGIHEPNSAAFQAALVALQLAASVANADGGFSLKELEQMQKQLSDWPHLSEGEHHRLLAHSRLMWHAPNSLGDVGPRVKALDIRSREAVARFIVTVAGADGQVSSDELRILQLAYRAMGLDTARVLEDVHRERILRRRTGHLRAGTGGALIDTTAIDDNQAPMAGYFAGTIGQPDAAQPPGPIEPDTGKGEP